MKRLTVADATKDEILMWFGGLNDVNGVLARKRFEDWLNRKRFEDLQRAYDAALDTEIEQLHLYTKWAKCVVNESDSKKKLALIKKANQAYDKYEHAEATVKRLEKKMDEWL